MDFYAYGEDALTLWALKEKLPELLVELGDKSKAADCTVFFRPSFGRSGGPDSPQFGEFDFILLADYHLYLGESKWDRSSERVIDGQLHLRPEQVLRHKLFAFYVEKWAFGEYSDWDAFTAQADPQLDKPLARRGTRLAENLQTSLNVIREHFTSLPTIMNLVLYFYRTKVSNRFPKSVHGDFKLISLDYAEISKDNYLQFNI